MQYRDAKLLTIQSVAKMLDMTPKRVRNLWRDGLLPSPIEFGGLTLWLHADIVVLVNLLSREYRHYVERAVPDGPKSVGIKHPALSPVREYLVSESSSPGIYFLVKDEQIVYVGSSLNPSKRIGQHRTGTRSTAAKDFDSSFVLPTPIEDLIETEKKFVALIDPPLNIALRREYTPDIRSALQRNAGGK